MSPPTASDRLASQLESVLEGAGLGAWDWYLDTNEVHFDRRWCSMLGIDFETVRHELKTWDERVHPDDKASAYHDIQAHLEGKSETYQNIHRLKHRDGHWVWILDQGKISRRSPDGKPLRFTGTHLDISKLKNQELLSEAVQSIANVGGWQLDVATGKTQWTPQVYKIHGIPLGTPTFAEMGISFYAAEEQARIRRDIQTCIDRGDPFSSLYQFTNAQGCHRWVQASGQPIRASDGKVVQIFGTFQDVTDQRASQLETDRYRHQLSSLISNTPGMVYQFRVAANGAMSFPFVSPRSYAIFEVEPQELASNAQLFVEMVVPSLQEELGLRIEKSRSELSPFDWQGQIRTGKGNLRWIHAQSTPTREPDGSTLWDGMIFDITSRKDLEAQLELERTKTLHQSKLASLGEMSAAIAHEINNPLAIIAANLQTLSRHREDPEKHEQKIQTLLRSSSRIERIISGLRKFSRSGTPLQRATHALAEIVKEALVLTESKARQGDVKVTSHSESEGLIHCNEIEIEQVVVNLVANAIDGAKSSQVRTVSVLVRDEPRHVLLQVTDSGPGIAGENLGKIFQPFFTTKPVGEGTGLGLSICRGILEEHRATIDYRRADQRTHFEVRFPKISSS